MAILTGIAFCVCLICLVFSTAFESAGNRAARDWFAVGFFLALMLTILCAGHWIALLLGRL